MIRSPRPLAFQLILLLVLVVVLVSGVSGVLRVRAVERSLHTTMVVGADQLSRGIVSATWHAMLADNRQDADAIMQAVARQPGIDRIRIYNKEGRIIFSTAGETGRVVDKNAEACVLCHARASPLVRVETPSRARIFSAADGGHRLAMITPIYNERACSAAACHAHPPRQNVLGVLDVALDLELVDRELAQVRERIVLTTAVEVLLISLFLAVFVTLLVSRPIRRLVVATTAMSRMQLDHPVLIRSSRELWNLSRSFDTMRERLQESLAQINRDAAELEAKVAERTEQLRQAQKRLLQADRLASLGQLAASVAHEINNPLSSVLNFSALMGRILKPDGIPAGRVAEFRGYLDRVSEQTARAGRIVSDLLAFSRRSKPQRAPADLAAIVRATMNVVQHKLTLMNVEASLQLAPDLPLVPCDASQIQQVVINLAMNGAEATRGKGAGHVLLAAWRAADRDAVVLQVEDDGEGIPEDTLGRIFDPFFTTKEDGKGVGLGLAVVYGIVEAHGGTIEVRSSVGRGTTVEVTLPLASGGHERAAAPDHDRHGE